METSLIRAEIDLNKIGSNIASLKALTPESTMLMAVVKANAYGHGAVKVAEAALMNGANFLGTARIDEAIELREAGIAAPVLVFGHTPPEYARTLSELGISQTVYSINAAQELADRALSFKRKIKIHLKIDTGMGRLGFVAANDAAIIATIKDSVRIADMKSLELEGVYTHFAKADEPATQFTQAQLDFFLNYVEGLKKMGVNPRIRHAANSAAIIDLPASHLDMVRAGISMYGYFPSPYIKQKYQSIVELTPAMTLKSNIINIKNVPKGFTVSYGSTYITPGKSDIATISAGYADGLNRLLSSKGEVLIHGKRAPVVGRVCMDLTMLDVTTINEAMPFDEVVIFGFQDEELLSADEIAAKTDTINYEVLTSVSSRVPRVYV